MATRTKTRRVAKGHGPMQTRSSPGHWGLSKKANRRNSQELESTLEKAREISLARSHEEKSEAARRAIQNRDRAELERTLERAREASLARSHEEKSEAARRAIQHRDRHELELTLEKAREASRARSSEEKSEAARKAALRRKSSSGFQNAGNVEETELFEDEE
jgi:hypothetical protein